MLRLSSALAALVALAACGSAVPAASPTAKATPTATPAPTATPDITVVSQAYLTPYNLLVTKEAALDGQWKAARIGTSALTNALNGLLAAYTEFDSTVSAIDVSAFPIVTQDFRAITSADAALENAYGLLVANDSNVTNYNGVFAAYTTAQAQFRSANALVFKDLGLVFTTPTP
jgi:hypothetical protein